MMTSEKHDDTPQSDADTKEQKPYNGKKPEKIAKLAKALKTNISRRKAVKEKE